MKKLLLLSCAILGCSGNIQKQPAPPKCEPQYQLIAGTYHWRGGKSGNDYYDQTVFRINLTTGETKYAVDGEWRNVTQFSPP